MMTVCIAPFQHKSLGPGAGAMETCKVFEVARCYTMPWGIVTPARTPQSADSPYGPRHKDASRFVMISTLRLAIGREIPLKYPNDYYSRRFQPQTGRATAAGARQPGLVAVGPRRARRRRQGHHQQ